MSEDALANKLTLFNNKQYQDIMRLFYKGSRNSRVGHVIFYVTSSYFDQQNTSSTVSNLREVVQLKKSSEIKSAQLQAIKYFDIPRVRDVTKLGDA